MIYCKKCGTQVQEGIKFCPKCGTEIQDQAKINDIEANKVMAVISYLGILIIIPLLKGEYKNSPFLKFHLNQGILFCIGWALTILLNVIPFIGGLLGGLFSFALAILEIVCIVYAVKGETKTFPIISKFKILK